MTRIELPNRRPSVCEPMIYPARSDPKAQTFVVGVGFDLSGRAREVFLSGYKIGSDAEANIQDACVLMSLLYQHGVDPAQLADQLSREGTAPGAPPASLMGAVAERVAAIQSNRD